MTELIKPGSDRWNSLVTASKVSAILGLSPYESPRSLWHKMRGDIPAQPQTRAQARGTHLEAGILDTAPAAVVVAATYGVFSGLFMARALRLSGLLKPWQAAPRNA